MSDERPVLVVDAANVVGSRPDGWWRDRHGATLRLRDALAPLTAAYRIILVVEGQARRVPASADVEVVAAPGAGDEEIVRVTRDRAATGRRVIVVTADRALRQRVAAVGAEVAGPSTLNIRR